MLRSSRQRLRCSNRTPRLLGLVAVLLLALACQPAGAPESGGGDTGNEYAFTRALDELIRLETRTGRTWRVPTSGDGGWTEFGPTPTNGGAADYVGRYRVSFLPGMRGQGKAPAALTRIDHATGRLWVMAIERESQWSLVGGESADGAPSSASDSPAEAAPPPSPAPEPTPARPEAAGLEIPSAADLPSVDLSPERANANLKAFADAVDKPHLPTEIRIWAVEQLGRYDAEQAGPILLRALSDGDPHVVVAAIESTNRVGYAAAIPTILKLQTHTNAEVKAAAEQAVKAVQ